MNEFDDFTNGLGLVAGLDNLTNCTSYTTHPDAVMIWKTFPPVLLACGTFGSVLSLIVLTQKSMRQSPMTSYLVLLAVMDILVLYTGLLRHWIKYYFDFEIRSLHIIICKIHPWVVYVTLDMSAWLLVCMTLERFVSVWKPYKVKTICTSKTTHLSIGVLVFVLIGINSHFLYGKEIIESVRENITIIKCTQNDNIYKHFLFNVFPWVDLCTFCLIPFTLQIVGNSIIIGIIVINARRMAVCLQNEPEKNTRRRQVSSMTIMLLTLNCVFLLCTSPVSVYLIFRGYWKIQNINYQSRSNDLIWVYTTCLMYFNNSFNFVFYCLSGRRFRAELKNVFKGILKGLQRSDTLTLSIVQSSFPLEVVDINTNAIFTTHF